MRTIVKTCAGIAWSVVLLTTSVVKAQDTATLVIPGLLQKVEVLRDQWGVNHIYAANQHDLFFAQGYCAAKDRLFQFEIWRRQATGTVAEILGPQELQRDIGARLFRYRGDMNKELTHYHAQGKEIITAFTAGINAYIEEANQHPQSLPVEFRLLHIRPGKWTPEVVISRHQGVLNNITEELNIGRAIARVGEAAVRKLLWLHPGNPNLKMDSVIQGHLLSQDILALYNAFRKDIVFTAKDIDSTQPGMAQAANNITSQAVVASNASTIQNTPAPPAFSYREPFSAGPEGSNNWVISGRRSASRQTMLASDPHRRITLPSLRYIVHLSAPGWNVTGGGEPEIPGVAIGHNEEGAWGITIHQTDAEDLYVYELNPRQLDQYRYKGRWVTMKTIEETIPVKGLSPVTTLLRYTVHGPVTAIDTVHCKAYAVRAGWLEPGAAPYLASLRMDQAKDWNAFREACKYSRLPALNMVWADKKGNIGWQVVGLIPVRKNFSGLVPVPGDGRYEWAGFLPIKERPHTFNPAKGYWATANEQLIPANFTHPDAAGYMWPDAYRAKRVNAVLDKDTAMDIAKMKALQTDYYSIPASELVPLLKSVTFEDMLLRKAKQEMEQWDFVMEGKSIAAGIYNKWEKELMLQADKKFVPEAIRGLIALQTTKLIEWLYKPATMFGPHPEQQRNQFLQETFTAAVNKLKLQLGDDITRWQYGQPAYKHIRFIHPLGELVNEAWKQKLNTASLPRSGYGHTVGATGNMDNQGNGASFRYITETGNWDATIMTNAPGQSGDPESRWYTNLFASWARDEYFPSYFTREKIEKATAEKWLLIPGRP